jgi:hypothetical protein
MRRRSKIDPAVERDLEALDAALAGERHDPEVELIADEARGSTVPMTPAFAERLEQAVGGGFAAPADARAARGWWPPRVTPALGLAGAACVAIAVALSSLGGDGPNRSALEGIAPATGARAAAGDGHREAPSSVTETFAPDASAQKAAPPTAAGGGSASALVVDRAARQLAPLQDSSVVVPPPGAGPRRLQRAADLTISTPIAELQDTSDAVTATVDRVGGFVYRSDVSASGENGSATFDLRIPSARLDDTLAALSKLGHVRSRSQSSQDITARFSSALSRLHDARAERQALLRALARATTTQEIESLRARIAIARRRIAAAKGSLFDARRASNLSRVGVTVLGVAGEQGGTAAGDRPWTPGRALHDALDVLSVAAGVAIVGSAAAIPAALLALLIALAWRAYRRRSRELALDTSTAAV